MRKKTQKVQTKDTKLLSLTSTAPFQQNDPVHTILLVAMDALLQSVLLGEVDVAVALQWALSLDNTPPPPELHRILTQSNIDAELTQTFPSTPSAFRSHILNFVREQADQILTVAESQPAPSGPGTPRARDPSFLGQRLISASSLSVQDSANTALPARATSNNINTMAGQQQDVEQLNKIQKVSKRLAPGAVDDLNFPALGSSKAGGGGAGATSSGAITVR